MELNKLKSIYIFTDWYIPGYRAGGPIQSVANMVSLFSGFYSVKIITRNTDYGSDKAYEAIIPNQWHPLGLNQEVMYLSVNSINLRSIKNICQLAKNDIVLINGIFSFYFSILPLFLTYYYNIQNTFVSVRGMFHKSALSVKPLKKQLFLAFARGFGLYKKATLLSTSHYESEEIINSLGKVKIKLAPNIPIHPLSHESLLNKSFKDLEGRLRLLFLGRISPEKNPLMVLKALNEIKYPVTITFIGSAIDTEYQRLFEGLLINLPKNINAEWIHELPHQQIQAFFSHTDVMILPSIGENFGHAIFESFAHGTPVIIGDNTPWKGLETELAGVEIDSDNIQSIINAIDRFNVMPDQEYKFWQAGSRKIAITYFESNNFEKVYLEIMENLN